MSGVTERWRGGEPDFPDASTPVIVQSRRGINGGNGPSYYRRTRDYGCLFMVQRRGIGHRDTAQSGVRSNRSRPNLLDGW
ncbi:MAG: hypothetical protein EOO77_23475 [Oxalobacteraceae bacterium]|nr:MAG: hypothetical protein EOO77_23475 [Oxalobacteraceae bacterium]